MTVIEGRRGIRVFKFREGSELAPALAEAVRSTGREPEQARIKSPEKEAWRFMKGIFRRAGSAKVHVQSTDAVLGVAKGEDLEMEAAALAELNRVAPAHTPELLGVAVLEHSNGQKRFAGFIEEHIEDAQEVGALYRRARSGDSEAAELFVTGVGPLVPVLDKIIVDQQAAHGDLVIPLPNDQYHVRYDNVLLRPDGTPIVIDPFFTSRAAELDRVARRVMADDLMAIGAGIS